MGVIINDVNYGDLIDVTIGDIVFSITQWNLDKLCLSNIKVTPFNGDIFLDMTVEKVSGGFCVPSIIHPKKQEDVLKLAKLISSATSGECVIEANARYLARFANGELVGRIRTLDEFYTNIDSDMLEKTRLFD